MRCPSCGVEVVDAAGLCPRCGEGPTLERPVGTDAGDSGAGPTGELVGHDESASSRGGPCVGSLFAGRFEILSRLGAGGMGEVFKAHDRELDETVALKTLRRDLARLDELTRRFKAEIKLARRIRHTNVAAVYELSQAEGVAFITMEYVEGEDLKTLLARNGLAPEERLPLVRQICLGLGAAHERGIVHRDLKPANVMVTPDGRVMVLDFGIARSLSTPSDTAGLVLGTPHYMAPEQGQGQAVGPPADLYALGVLMYELFTGRLPFSAGTPLALALKHLHETPTPPTLHAVLPPGLEDVILKALAKDPARRYQTTAELLADLDRSTLGAPLAAAPEAKAARAPEKKRLCLVALSLSGFGRLAEELEPAELTHVQCECLSSLESAVVRFGGTVMRRETHALLAAYSFPAVRESDAERALSCARAARTTLERINVQLAEALRLRTGLHAEHVLVSWESGLPELLGEAPALTTSIATAVPAGRIGASQPFVDLLPRGQSVFSGEPAFSVTREETKLPVLLDSADRPTTRHGALESFAGTIVGRRAELEAMCEALGRVAGGQGELLGISGEAGIGKSRLVFELVRAARERGFEAIAGSCRTLEEQSVLTPVSQIVRQALALPEDVPEADLLAALQERLAALPEALQGPLPALAALLGLGHPAIAAMTDSARRQAFREALLVLLVWLAKQTPLLLIVEDAHWLDPASLEVLEGVAGRLQAQRILFCCVQRPDFDPPWSRDPSFTRLALRPLPENEAATLARAACGANDLDAPLVDLLRQRAEGNPFFIEELLKGLVERGLVEIQRGRARLAGGLTSAELPARIEDVILARLDRLEARAREALESASVIGRSFPVRLLDRLLKRGTREEELPQLTAAGMVYEKEILPELAYIFKHAAIRDVAYRGILERRRKDLHRRLAGGIEELYAGRLDEWWEVLAHHWEQAADYQMAMRCYERASTKARERVGDGVSAHFARKEEKMAEALLEAPIATRTPWRTGVNLIVASLLGLSVFLVAVDKLIFRKPTAWLELLVEGTPFVSALAVIALLVLAVFVFFERQVMRATQLASVVYPDRLTLRLRHGSVDLPFEELTDVSLCATKLTLTAMATNIGSAFGSRSIYVGREPHGPRRFWQDQRDDITLMACGFVAIVLGLLGWVFLMNHVNLDRLFGGGTWLAKWVAIVTGCGLPIACIGVALGLPWFVFVRPRVEAMLERSLRRSRLVAISPGDPDGFYAALTTALEKYRRDRASVPPSTA